MGGVGLLRRIGVGLGLGLVLAAVPAAAADGSFQPYQAYPVGSWPDAVAIGDVTGDGRDDVVMTTRFYFDARTTTSSGSSHRARTGRSRHRSSYPTAATYSNGPDSVAIGDLTGDGRADVVLGLAGLGIQVFPQLASGGTWWRPSLTAITDSGRSASAGSTARAARRRDIGWGTDTVSVLLNDGAGGLRAPTVVSGASTRDTTTWRSAT